MILISLSSLALAIGFYSVSQLLQHEKFKWSDAGYTFWGGRTDLRKYKFPLESYQGNWYYRFFKIKYKERFPLSATFLVSLTDGYHFMQFWSFNFLALSLTFALGFNWWLLVGLLIGIRLVHFIVYHTFQK